MVVTPEVAGVENHVPPPGLAAVKGPVHAMERDGLKQS
jgi:hypothetical protein